MPRAAIKPGPMKVLAIKSCHQVNHLPSSFYSSYTFLSSSHKKDNVVDKVKRLAIKVSCAE